MRAGVGTQAFGSTLQVKLGGRVSMWQEPGVKERGWDHRKGSLNAPCCSPHKRPGLPAGVSQCGALAPRYSDLANPHSSGCS